MLGGLARRSHRFTWAPCRTPLPPVKASANAHVSPVQHLRSTLTALVRVVVAIMPFVVPLLLRTHEPPSTSSIAWSSAHLGGSEEIGRVTGVGVIEPSISNSRSVVLDPTRPAAIPSRSSARATAYRFEADEEHWHGAARNRLMGPGRHQRGWRGPCRCPLAHPVTHDEYAAARGQLTSITPPAAR
jgi:hypothetical protein